MKKLILIMILFMIPLMASHPGPIPFRGPMGEMGYWVCEQDMKQIYEIMTGLKMCTDYAVYAKTTLIALEEDNVKLIEERNRQERFKKVFIMIAGVETGIIVISILALLIVRRK